MVATLTCYEALHTEINQLRTKRIFALAVPATIIAALVSHEAISTGFSSRWVLVTLAAFLLSLLALHPIEKAIFPIYRQWWDRSTEIVDEIKRLRTIVTVIFEKYREREKGEQFKIAYNLVGKTLPSFEETLSVGMFRERREVFVTAFMRKGITVRVTAAIGSPYRCSASDNPSRWKDHVERLGCDEIRQYHNHPVHNGKTEPSPTDFSSSRSLRSVLQPDGEKLRSFIICWNGIREWKIIEYVGEGKWWLDFEFDASVDSSRRTA